MPKSEQNTALLIIDPKTLNYLWYTKISQDINEGANKAVCFRKSMEMYCGIFTFTEPGTENF
jgi:hypothetical protein